MEEFKVYVEEFKVLFTEMRGYKKNHSTFLICGAH